MKVVPVEAAEGMVLCHDLTRIVPGECKGRAFRKGHVIHRTDIPDLLKMGKENIYVFDLTEGLVHEDDAARRIAGAAAGDGLKRTDPCEGRVNLIATRDGLLKIDVDALHRINLVENVAFSTLHGNQPVKAGQSVAGTRIIPLVAPEETIRSVEAVGRDHRPVVEIRPFLSRSVGIVTTGSEIYHGRIQDQFGPVLRKKYAELGCPVIGQEFVSDDREMTAAAIRKFVAEGAEMVAVTGGMSVDPDDQTPAGIRAAGAEVVAYGSPIFPGAMFLLAYIGDVPVLGLPGCVMYYRASVFDLVVPRILAGDRISPMDIAAMGHGGFCASCEACRYPRCGFGKGS